MEMRHTYYPSNAKYGLNLLFSGKEECPSGYTFGPAKRTNYLLHYIEKGKGTYSVSGKSYTLTANKFFVIYPGDITIYSADSKDPWTYLWIGFDGPDCDDMLMSLGITNHHHICTSADPDRSLDFLNRMVYSEPNELANPLRRSAFISGLLASFSHVTPLHEHHKASAIEQALDFIHQNYQYDVKISHLASTVNLDRTWLYRLFQDEMGRSPKVYLTEYRLKIAKEYLRTSDLTLTEIALSCGFSSSSAFHKHFKKAFGITPKAYRKDRSGLF